MARVGRLLFCSRGIPDNSGQRGPRLNEEKYRHGPEAARDHEENELRTLSPEAQEVLGHMRRGCPLVGSIFRRSAPFDLEIRTVSEEVEFTIVAELVENGYIVPVAARGPDRAEYGLRNRSLFSQRRS